MTTIYKSNATSSRSLGNISGIKDVGYALLLDFNTQTYKSNIAGNVSDIALADAVSFTRNSSASYYNAAGSLTTVDANIPRIALDKPTGKLGLLLETSHTNLVPSPHSPTNQSVPITHNANDRFVLYVHGSGSASIEGDDIVTPSGTVRIATKGNPAEYKSVVTGDAQLNITGSPSFVGFRQVNSFNGKESLNPHPVGATGIASESLKLTDNMFNTLIKDKNEFTVYIETISAPRDNSSIYTTQTNFFRLVDTTTSDTGIYAYRVVGTSPRIRVKFISGTSNVNAVLDNTLSVIKTAFSFDKTSSTYLTGLNGAIYNRYPLDAYTLSPNQLLFGSGGAYNAGTSLNGIITKIVIYPKKMDGAELQALTS